LIEFRSGERRIREVHDRIVLGRAESSLDQRCLAGPCFAHNQGQTRPLSCETVAQMGERFAMPRGEEKKFWIGRQIERSLIQTVILFVHRMRSTRSTTLPVGQRTRSSAERVIERYAWNPLCSQARRVEPTYGIHVEQPGVRKIPFEPRRGDSR